MSGAMEELVRRGRDAVAAGDGAAALAIFTEAHATRECGETFEGLGQAHYLELDYGAAIDLFERAYAAYRSEGDSSSATRLAGRLSYLYGTVRGDWSVSRGWLARGQTLLGGAENSQQGWVQLNLAIFEPDRASKEDRLRAAIEVARRFGDPDLEAEALAYLGASLVHEDRTDEGMAILDEAMASIVGGEATDFMTIESVFCQLFGACEYAHDVGRAEEWVRVGEDIAARRHLPVVSAWCRTHYGAILTAAGRWTEAEEHLTGAVRIWKTGRRALSSNALIRLADLRVRQGRFEEAEQLLEGYDTYWESGWALGSIHLARGEPVRAADVLERALAQVDQSSSAAARLWALLVEVHLATGDHEGADSAATRLEHIAATHPGHYLYAAAALARGSVCLETGTGDPRACLGRALASFAQAQMPLELARTRLEMARALTADRPEVAIAEAKAALESFERLEAARQADAAAAMLRSLGVPARVGPKGSRGLTKREAEVLELLGHGLSNPEISDRLFISRKTVEHHVGRVLAKLGLRTRAEAAAHAARRSVGR